MPSCTGWIVWRTHWRNVWFISNKSSGSLPWQSLVQEPRYYLSRDSSQRKKALIQPSGPFSWAQVCAYQKWPLLAILGLPFHPVLSPYRWKKALMDCKCVKQASQILPAGCLHLQQGASGPRLCSFLKLWTVRLACLCFVSTLQLLVMTPLVQDSPVRAFAINHSILGLRVEAAFTISQGGDNVC